MIRKKNVQQQSRNKTIRLTLNVGVKLFLLILLSILLSVGITGVVTLSVSNNIIEQKTAETAYETIQQTSAKVDTILVVYEQIVLQILSNINLHNDLYTATNDRVAIYDQLTARNSIQDLLNQVAYSNNTIKNISLISIQKTLQALRLPQAR